MSKDRQCFYERGASPGSPGYLVDHYSILGVDRFSSIETVVEAYRSTIKRWHPDMVANAAKELQEAAQRRSDLLTKAYKVLADPDLKKEYDAALNDADPRLVSKDGVPIEVIGRRGLDLERMIAGKPLGHGKALLAHAEVLSSHNDRYFKRIQDRYRNAKDPDQDLREEYLRALICKNSYLAIVEDTAWADAGMIHQPEPGQVSSPSGYLEQRIAQVDEVKELIRGSVDRYVKQIGSDQAKLLLPDSRGSSDGQLPAKTSDLGKDITGYALKGFSRRIPSIVKAARERSEVLEEMVQFTKFEYYPAGQKRHDQVDVLISADDTIAMVMRFVLERGAISNTDEVSKSYQGWSIKRLKSPKSLPSLTKRLDAGSNVIILYSNKDIPTGLELGYVLNRHFQIGKGKRVG
ncbi:MAG: J domain-containing protein [Nanoarchaeota archaeon]